MIDPENVQRRENIILTVDVVVTFDWSHILLIKRKYPPFEDKLVLPGGHVDPGETTEDAARRELAEETGLIIDPMDELELLTVLDAPDRDPRPDGRRVSIVYTINMDSSMIEGLKAGSDAKELVVRDFWTITHEEVGFDHFQAIRASQLLC